MVVLVVLGRGGREYVQDQSRYVQPDGQVLDRDIRPGTTGRRNDERVQVVNRGWGNRGLAIKGRWGEQEVRAVGQKHDGSICVFQQEHGLSVFATLKNSR